MFWWGREPNSRADHACHDAGLPGAGDHTARPGEGRVLQDVLDQVVASPDSRTGSKGATAAAEPDHWTWSGSAGKDAHGTALRPETSMAVASITKTFVAAEVMLLDKAGKVELDKPISTYVQNKLTANNATVRQHLSMTSGVPDYLNEDYRELDKAVAAAPGKHWTLGQVLSYHTGTIGAPGSASGYSNPSYELLGLLIEKVAGRPLAVVLRRDLATPAGLTHAAFQDGEKPQPPAAIDDNESCGDPDGYQPCRAFASAVAAAGGLAADAPTVARWGYQLYGARVLPADLVSEMTKGHGEYGLGTMLFPDEIDLGPAYGHFGDNPDHTSVLVVVPAKKVAAAMIFADGGRDIGKAMTELTKALQPLVN
ncbi:serine hydrolase domain-containing protein [Kribbella sp. CWNU-51]